MDSSRTVHDVNTEGIVRGPDDALFSAPSAAQTAVPATRDDLTYIPVEVLKSTVDRFQLKRHRGYGPGDLMVDSGFLQWLSVFALATDPGN